MIEYTVKVYSNGTKAWHLKGKLHRTDGPACEFGSGNKLWYLDGKKHRTDGPAAEYANGDKEWYLNGKEVTEQEVMSPTKELTIVEIEKLLGHKVKVVSDVTVHSKTTTC